MRWRGSSRLPPRRCTRPVRPRWCRRPASRLHQDPRPPEAATAAARVTADEMRSVSGLFAMRPSLYEVDLTLTGIRYTYGFEIDDDRVRGEWLHSYPKGRKQIWFDRQDDEIEFPGEGLRGEKLELARRTRSDGLFLSVAAQFNHDQLLPVFEWFRDNLSLSSPEANRFQRQEV